MSLYDQLRHFADGYGLALLIATFAGLCLWPFRPGAKRHHLRAAHSIFEEESERD